MKKTESILKLQELGLNTLDCFITKDPREAAQYLSYNFEIPISMRTERGYEFLCPFYFMIKGKDMIENANKHISEGYTLLLYPALPTKGCLAFGTIGFEENGCTVIEYVPGEGKVRELDTHPRKRLIVKKPGTMGFVTKEESEVSVIINEVLTETKLACWDEPPCIVEWSYYNRLIGNLQKNSIYWELRRYEN